MTDDRSNASDTDELFERAVKAMYAVAHRDRYEGQLNDVRYCAEELWRFWSLRQAGLLTPSADHGFLHQFAAGFDRVWAKQTVRFPWLEDNE